jgi:hypothetical protein
MIPASNKGLGSCLLNKGYFFIVEIVKCFPEILPFVQDGNPAEPAWNVSRIQTKWHHHKQEFPFLVVYSLYKSLDKHQPHLIGSIVNCFVFSKIVEELKSCFFFK